MLTPDDIRDIVRVLDSTTLDELHVQIGDLDVTLRRHGSSSGWTAETLVTRTPIEVPGSAQAGVPGPATAVGGAPDAAEADDGHLYRVTPPLLGTFYRAPQPGAAPFVEVGSIVQQVLRLVEELGKRPDISSFEVAKGGLRIAARRVPDA